MKTKKSLFIFLSVLVFIFFVIFYLLKTSVKSHADQEIQNAVKLYEEKDNNESEITRDINTNTYTTESLDVIIKLDPKDLEE